VNRQYQTLGFGKLVGIDQCVLRNAILNLNRLPPQSVTRMARTVTPVPPARAASVAMPQPMREVCARWSLKLADLASEPGKSISLVAG